MGLSASCVLIRNEQCEEQNALLDKLRSYMRTAGFTETDTAGADIVLRLRFSENGQYFAVLADAGSPADLHRCAALSAGAFNRPVILAELIDSDFAMLSVLSENGQTAGKLYIGEPYWGRDAADYDCLSALAGGDPAADQISEICEDTYIFAEDGLEALGRLMNFDASLLPCDPEVPDAAVLGFQRISAEPSEAASQSAAEAMPAGVRRISLITRTMYENDKFAYLFQNPEHFSLQQLLEKLDAFLAAAYGPEKIPYFRYDSEHDALLPCTYEDPGGICRTDQAHAEGFLRVIVTDNGIALSGNLEVPNAYHYASVPEQDCLAVQIDGDNGFAVMKLTAPDGTLIGSDMIDIKDIPAFCSRHGFDPALLDAVDGNDAVICFYRRPEERSPKA